MRLRSALLIAWSLMAAACSPPSSEAPLDQIDTAVAAPLVSSSVSLTCAVSYRAERGPMLAESLAVLTLVVDAGDISPGWRVERVLVTKSLDTEDGFDPWLQFRTPIDQPFVARNGPELTLADYSGSPLTLNQTTGALDWRSDGVLGATSYTGVCR